MTAKALVIVDTNALHSCVVTPANVRPEDTFVYSEA